MRRRMYEYVDVSGRAHGNFMSNFVAVTFLRSFAHLKYMQPDVIFIRLMWRDRSVADSISGFLIFFGIFGIFGIYRARIYGGCCLHATANL